MKIIKILSWWFLNVIAILGVISIGEILSGQEFDSQVPSLDFPDYAEPIITEESDLEIHFEFPPYISKEPCYTLSSDEYDVFEISRTRLQLYSNDLSMDNYTDISKAPCFTKE